MTDVSPAAREEMSAAHDVEHQREVTGWAGWVTFGGVMMILLGVFQAIEALVALFNSDYYVVGASGLAVSFDFTTWGWVHLVIGVVSVGAGFGLLAGDMAARVVAVVFAMLSAIANLMFIAAFPLWATLVITVDVVIIYAIVAHGRELKA
ncbi:MAG TPA: hypothetical protein VGP26_22045 [Actinophytocola sp.]|jgi:hypothetical protein|nr:hypothetical protein [Actinophytocola sp.]